MKQVTKAQLEAVVERINRMTNSPLTSYTRDENDMWRANIGNYHLSGAYGGYALHRMCNESGGVQDVLQIGHAPKRELLNAMFAFIRGIESVQS